MESNHGEQLFLNPKPGTAAAAARDFGIDLTLTVQNLRLAAEERVRRLHSFIDEVRQLRNAPVATDSHAGD